MTQIHMNDERYFGDYGGSYVPDTLMPALTELGQAYEKLKQSQNFQTELSGYLHSYAGRETPLYYARNLSQVYGCEIYLKREDLLHTGAHKINNTLGQILVAKHMGKKRIIAETGAGQHGVATATAAALMGFPCVVYMGAEDIERQALNVYRMRLLGAEVKAVHSGSKTLKDATTEAIRDWMASVEDTHYIIGSALGPHPYPSIVRDFHCVIGEETKQQCMKAFSCLPDAVIACVGGGSNAIGMFHPFINDKGVDLIAVEAAGKGLDSNQHAAPLMKGRPGILHGSKSYLLQDDHGQVAPVHSVSAGLDYPGVGPELSHLKDIGRLVVGAATDKEALDACLFVSKKEGIIPALETAHAFAVLNKKQVIKDYKYIVICLSGRGDKDLENIQKNTDDFN